MSTVHEIEQAVRSLGPEELAAFRAWFVEFEAQVKRRPVEEARQVDLSSAFKELADCWRRETGMLSSITRKLNHPAYQKIIEMGESVVPLILAELETRPGFWFEALEKITGESPIPNDRKVDLATAVQEWLAWGRARGYLKA